MNRPLQYLAAVLTGSATLLACVLHSGVSTARASDLPPHSAKVEIVRVPPSTQPAIATQPSSQPAHSDLPEEFAIFKTRNAFARGKALPPGAASGPETNFVLRGVVQNGDRLIAFVEDKAAKRVTEVSSGDAIARGKIASVNLDGIEYQSAGPAKAIKVGQDFYGQVVPPTPTSKPVAAPQPGQEQPPGQPQPGVPSDMPPGGPPRGKSRSAPAVIERG